MRAAIFTAAGGPEVVRVDEVADPRPEVGEGLVTLRTAALNHRDAWQREGGTESGSIPGSDGAGLLADGSEVVIVPYLRWGGREDGPAADGEILGIPHPGTHAELIAVPQETLRPRPERLSWEESAALPLA